MSQSESRSEIVLELAEQFLERYRRGERPSLKDYVDRHPQLAEEIREVFPAMAMMENIALADESIDDTDGMASGAAIPLDQLGDYRIIREVGHGGMGMVYEAEQVSLGRHVALKVLPQKLLSSAKQKQRFEREAKAAAKLHHTNIVPVFGVGEKDGMPYYVMQFIQGLGLDQVLTELRQLRIPGAPTPNRPTDGESRISRGDVSAANMARSLITGEFAATQSRAEGEDKAELAILHNEDARQTVAVTQSSERLKAAMKDTTAGKQSDSSILSASSVVLPGQSASSRKMSKKQTYWQSVASIGVQVADALDYAHNQGVLHRDIKPSNLLLDTRGTVWVTDFGLAKTDDQQNLTHTGDILGTLRYMSPEAFEGKSDARSDVYSLGLTIYELLALHPAFDERDRHRLIKRVTTEVPPRLNRVNTDIPRDLVTIVHKAIDKDPAQRYQSSDELGADFQRFIDDEPIKARRLRPRERAWRWCRHNPLVAVLAAALLLLMLSSTVGSLLAASYYDRLATREAQSAEDERAAHLEATANLEEAERQKQRAEANFVLARAAVDDYLTKVSESQLIKVPGLQPLRRELLQSAMGFYEGFLTEHGNSPGIQGELAAAHLRVARITGELGNQAEARKSFYRAIAGYEAALQTQPGSLDLKFGLADCWSSMGMMYFYSDVKNALVAFGKAAEIQEDLLSTNSSSEASQEALARTYNGLAVMQFREGDVPSALQSFQRCVALRQDLVLKHPDSPVLQHALGECLGNTASMLDSQGGHTPEALAMYERSAGYARAAYERMPHVLEYGVDLAIEYAKLASSNLKLGLRPQGLAYCQLRTDHLTKLAEANQAIPLVQTMLLDALFDLGFEQVQSKDLNGSSQTLSKIGAALARLPRQGADEYFISGQSRMRYAALLESCKFPPNSPEEQTRLRQPELAIQDLRKAIAAGFHDKGRLENNGWFATLRPRNDFQALIVRIEASQPAKAVGMGNEPTRPDTPGKPEALHPSAGGSRSNLLGRGQLEADLALTHYAIALAQIDGDQLAEAKKSLDQARPILEALEKNDATRAQYGPYLGSIQVARGMHDWRAGRFAEGKRQWDQSLQYLEEARRREPTNAFVLARLRDSLTKIGTMWALAGCWKEAAEFWQRAADLAPTDHWLSCQLGALLALVDDPARYHRHCEQMLARAVDTSNPTVAEQTAKVCLLLPAENKRLKSATVLCDRAIELLGSENVYEPYYILLKGLAEYRKGNMAAAVKLLQGIPARFPNSREDVWAIHLPRKAVLAMALFREGHKEEARALLGNALSQQGNLRSYYCVVPRNGWDIFNGLIARVLLKEAHQVILGNPLNESLTAVLRAHVYQSLGDREKAAKELRNSSKPNENNADELAHWGAALAKIGLADQARTDYDKALQINPKSAPALLERGELLVSQRHWKEAIPDFTNYVTLVQEGDWVFRLAALLVQADDLEGYHRHCLAVVGRFGETSEAAMAERAAKACLFSPVKGSYGQGALGLADKALGLDKGDWLTPFLRFVKGLADYRRGNYREAAVMIRLSLASTEPIIWFLRVEDEFVLSMALANLNDLPGARAALARGAKVLSLAAPRFERSGHDGDWHDWLICRFLHAEAKKVLESKAIE